MRRHPRPHPGASPANLPAVASPAKPPSGPGPAQVPTSTYRLQFGAGMGFSEAAGLVDYLDALGVGALYLSPVFVARPGSSHGYDVVDHGRLNPELGTEEEFRALAARLRGRGLGLILDVVPNHMCIGTPDNAWWSDVLENGPASPFARFFDVDWAPPKTDLAEKVLLPVLGEQYGQALEGRRIQVRREGGALFVEYPGHRFPLAPKTWDAVLLPTCELARALLGPTAPEIVELESILTSLAHLPERSDTRPDAVQERQREKEVVKRRLGQLLEVSETVRGALEASLQQLNGTSGDPRSFDRLEALLARQAYRLSHWRVAADEINYRRFFDVNELGALRVEEPEVFEAVHALPSRLTEEGLVTGLRIDHVDGLYDPADYLQRLPAGTFRVVEKILVGDEDVPATWPVHGTTGYDLLQRLDGILVDVARAGRLPGIYRRFTGDRERFEDVAYECRKLVLEVSMSAELTMLARRLDRLSEQHRFSRDFTLNSQQGALADVVACFPVYRTYVRAGDAAPRPADRRAVERAISAARRRNPAIDASLFDFVASVLLLEDPEGLDEAQRRERRDFVLRFQQFTGPVMAKGIEDTAFYRFHPLCSLNEVGGDPLSPGTTPRRFHAGNAGRRRAWPHSLTATSTHDTKRDEDTRARIAVLSEVPGLWERSLQRWQEENRPHRSRLEGEDVPDARTEYYLYQTLVGCWPQPRPTDLAPTVGRLQEHLRKALREAKLRTSWVQPDEAYEGAVASFVAACLDPSRGGSFLQDLEGLLGRILRPGLLNAVSQVVLKVAGPGVPDVYQGTEMPEFRLVDPDNRRPVDFDRRRRALAILDREAEGRGPDLARELLADPGDGRLKLFVTSRALRLRRRRPKPFADGEYLPLRAAGPRGEHVVAFARRARGQAVVAAAARFFTRLPDPPVGETAWGETGLRLGDGAGDLYRDTLTGTELRPVGAGGLVPLAEVFAHLPVALLERVR